MSTSPLNVALIGCGRIAGHHCSAISSVEGVELAAVCDLDLEKAKAYGSKYSVPSYASYREMFDSCKNIDIAAVITPSGMHLEHGVEMLRDYKKHVIMEKPTFMRPEDLIHTYTIAKNAGLHIFPVFQNRYNKAVRSVKQAIQNGSLGDIRIVSVRVRWCRPQRYYDMAPWRGTFSHDGGALANQSIHHIDLIRYFGGEVARVNAQMRTLGAEIEVEDTVAASIEFYGDAVGVVEATTSARPDDFEASISLVCSKGLAQIGGIAVNELQVFTPDDKACAKNSENFQGIKGAGAVYGYGHGLMYQDIVSFFNDGKAYPISRDDCLGTLKLLHAFYRSDEEGGWVDVDSEKQSKRLGRPDEAISSLYRTPNR